MSYLAFAFALGTSHSHYALRIAQLAVWPFGRQAGFLGSRHTCMDFFGLSGWKARTHVPPSALFFRGPRRPHAPRLSDMAKRPSSLLFATQRSLQ